MARHKRQGDTRRNRRASASRKAAQYYSRREGLSPGEYLAGDILRPLTMRLVRYNSEKVVVEDLPVHPEGMSTAIKAITGAAGAGQIAWLHIPGNLPRELGLQLAKALDMDTLTLESIESNQQRPKVEVLRTFTYITCRAMFHQDGGILEDQANFVLGKNYLITFSNGAVDADGEIHTIPDWTLHAFNRIKLGKGLVRTRDSDYLCYTLLDTIIDKYFIVMDQWEQDMDEIEDGINFQSEENYEITDLKNRKDQLIQIRRAIWPLREVLIEILRPETTYVDTENSRFFRDAYDHLLVLQDMIETMRESLSDLIAVQATVVSNRLNQVMKLLTMLSAIFIPITFVSGIFGMNFASMPLVDSAIGFAVVLGFMGLIVVGMLILFKRKKWF